MNGDVEMGCTMQKNRRNKLGNPLSNTIKDTSTIMRNPFALCREGLRMIVLVSLIVLLRGLPSLFPRFFAWCIPFLHPHSFIFALVAILSPYTVSLYIAVLGELTVCLCPQDGWTALHVAAQEGEVDVVRLLTEAQAQVNIQAEVHPLCHVS